MSPGPKVVFLLTKGSLCNLSISEFSDIFNNVILTKFPEPFFKGNPRLVKESVVLYVCPNHIHQLDEYGGNNIATALSQAIDGTNFAYHRVNIP